jgi:hypothetical protein
MQSKIDPRIVYPINRGVASHDFDVEADSWNYGGVDVFRGTADKTYSHADVYWIYDEDIQRIGLAEHKIDMHEVFHVLWFYECPFASLLQEEGWVSTDETIWTRIPSHVYEYCLDNSLTTVEDIRKLCLHGEWRIVTPSCVMEKGHRYPNVSKILFADYDCILYTPPAESAVWSKLQLAYDGSQAQPKLAQERSP